MGQSRSRSRAIPGIGPAGTQNSDLVCGFQNNDPALITRSPGIQGDIEIVGQARVVSQEPLPMDEPERYWPPPVLNTHGPPVSHKSSIGLSLDVIALQALTRPLEFENQNISKNFMGGVIVCNLYGLFLTDSCLHQHTNLCTVLFIGRCLSL
jgi:hypothetical protein